MANPKGNVWPVTEKLYPATFNVLPTHPFETVKNALEESGIQYPFIVKPEVGCQGILFRKIDTEAALQHYHSKIPVEYIIQALVSYPMEVSVFYIRHPQQQKERLPAFAQDTIAGYR